MSENTFKKCECFVCANVKEYRSLMAKATLEETMFLSKMGERLLSIELISEMTKVREQEKAEARCTWVEDEDGIWDTECCHLFETISGSPSGNGMRICPYCGAKIEEKGYYGADD
jgi:hypothetical protein